MASMKLNLRDLFWLILVFAVATSWWVERQAGRFRDLATLAELEKRIEELQSENMFYKTALERASAKDPK
jgi:uncharacterized membrane protein (DUF106 family)